MGSYLKTNMHRYPMAANANIAARDLVYINASGYAAAAPSPAAMVPTTGNGVPGTAERAASA